MIFDDFAGIHDRCHDLTNLFPVLRCVQCFSKLFQLEVYLTTLIRQPIHGGQHQMDQVANGLPRFVNPAFKFVLLEEHFLDAGNGLIDSSRVADIAGDRLNHMNLTVKPLIILNQIRDVVEQQQYELLQALTNMQIVLCELIGELPYFMNMGKQMIGCCFGLCQ